jgi:hypothetical protein
VPDADLVTVVRCRQPGSSNKSKAKSSSPHERIMFFGKSKDAMKSLGPQPGIWLNKHGEVDEPCVMG